MTLLHKYVTPKHDEDDEYRYVDVEVKKQVQTWFEHESVVKDAHKDVHNRGEHVYSEDCLVCVDAVISFGHSIWY